jgi:ABC-type transport system involved in multi-copper enzyme maturation permease subunit
LSPAAEIRVLVTRELRRSVRSAKGIVLAVLTLLGALAVSLVCVYVEERARLASVAASADQIALVKRELVEQLTGSPSLGATAATIPLSLLVFLKLTVWLSPLLIALLGFDIVSGELQHRTVRFWALRTRRSSYFTAKLLGLWAVVGIITFALDTIAGGVALAKGFTTPGQLLNVGLRFWMVAFVIAGAWAALAAFISSCFRTPVLALLTTFGAFFLLWLCGVRAWFSRAPAFAAPGEMGGHESQWYGYLYPNGYAALLLSPEPNHVLLGLAVLLGFIVLMIAFGSVLFRHRDI